MRVEHFMTKDPVVCDVGDTLRDVAKLMRDKAVGCVIVLERGRLRWLVTDRTLAVEGLAKGHSGNVRIERLLPPRNVHPAAVGVDDNVFAVVDTLRSGGVVRRLPVLTPEGEVVGIVSISDVAVMAKDLLDAVLLDETHNATKRAHVLTGGKRIAKVIRRPTKAQAGRLPPEPPTRRVLGATARGRPRKAAGAGRPPQVAVSARRSAKRAVAKRRRRSR